MRAALRRAAPLLFLLAAPAAAADLGEYLFTRPLDVPAAGPVAVPLDLATLRGLGAGEPAVFDADGRVVPSRVRHDCCRLQAELVEARREGESWLLLLDLGAEPPLHEQLHFQFRRMTAAAVRLEGSDDRAAWRPLAAGNLFRLGSDGAYERTALTYAPNRHRWLRLTWPAAAGTPELRWISVVSTGRSALPVESVAPACRREGAALVCGVPLPGRDLMGLRFHLRLAAGASGPAGGRMGYRLSDSFLAKWETLAEGTAPLAAGAVAVPLPTQVLRGESLRLELYGDTRPAGWTLELARKAVVFHAPRAGRYTLAYGGGRKEEDADPRPAIDATGAVSVVPGPETRQPPSPLPAAATAPGMAIDAKLFEASWPVRAPRARAGDVVRLELPPAVLAITWGLFDQVRLAAGRRQLPYVPLETETPVLVHSRRGLRPQPERGGRTSRVAFAVDRKGFHESLSLTAAPPFQRWVTVSQRVVTLPLWTTSELDRGSWDCSAQPPLPCRWQGRSIGLGGNRVVVRFDDGDNPPLPRVDAALWRERYLLAFVWPAGGEVRLLAGSSALKEPRYDLEALAPQLLARPWRAAAVDVGGGTRREERGPAWLPLLVPMALAWAAVMLIFILSQVIGKRP